MEQHENHRRERKGYYWREPVFRELEGKFQEEHDCDRVARLRVRWESQGGTSRWWFVSGTGIDLPFLNLTAKDAK